MTPIYGRSHLRASARKGSAEILILASLEDGQLHGYDIAREIARKSGGLLTFHVASLYPLLYKIEDRGWIHGRWVEKAGQRRRRYYRLTAEGRRTLATQRGRWAAFVAGPHESRGLETCLSHRRHRWHRRLANGFVNGWPPKASRRRRIEKRSTRSPNTSNDLHRGAIAQGTRPRRTRRDGRSRAGSHGTAGARRGRAREARAGALLPESHDWKSGIAADLRHALRAIRLNRSFSAIVVLTLAIGIGSCTAVFSIVNALLFGSLPYPNPEQLTLVWETDARQRESRIHRRATRSTRTGRKKRGASRRWASGSTGPTTSRPTQEPEQVQGIRATSSLFTTLGVSPALGRVFTEEEEAPGHHVVVISDSVWRNHFAAQASAIGSTIAIERQPFEVIGVMPKGFEFPYRRNGVWVPFREGVPGRAARLAFVLGRGADETRRHVRAGARRRRAGRPRLATEVTRRTATRARRSR